MKWGHEPAVSSASLSAYVVPIVWFYCKIVFCIYPVYGVSYITVSRCIAHIYYYMDLNIQTCVCTLSIVHIIDHNVIYIYIYITCFAYYI